MKAQYGLVQGGHRSPEGSARFGVAVFIAMEKMVDLALFLVCIEDISGNLWVGVQDGLWKWKPGQPKFYSLRDAPDGIQAIAEEVSGELLIGWKGGIYRFIDGETGAFSPAGTTPRFRTYRMLRDQKQLVYGSGR